MTLDEMQKNMNMSKSNMSYAVRISVESQMVSKLKEKDERKDLYIAGNKLFQGVSILFRYKASEGNRRHAGSP